MSFFASLFGKGKKDGRFVTEAEYQKGRKNQARLTPQLLGELRKRGVVETSKLKLEFFFYTNTLEKAAGLADALKQKGYEVEYGRSEGDKRIFVITGWSTPIMMDDSTVAIWDGEICDLGYRHDCDFDGWGTYPDQE